MQELRQSHRMWRVAQWAAVGVLAFAIAGMYIRPSETLPVVWNVVLPILPVSFLVSPALWRAVCPFATLNVLTGDRPAGRLSLSKAAVLRAGAFGITLLFLLIPARHVILNTNGLVLGTTLLLLGVVALVAGLRYRTKAGFCNSVCPILPVEKLYGQYPLLKIDNPRCVNCELCTAKGCWDLDATKSAVMPTRSAERHWTLTAFGFFAAAFPGIALGYFLRADGDSVATVYATTLGLGGVSWVVFAALARGFRLKAELLLPVLGAIAIAIYYFFAARSMAATLGAGEAAIIGIRVGTWGLTAFWLWRAMRSLLSAQVRQTARPQPAVLPRNSGSE